MSVRVKYKDYADYLKSNKWKDVKEAWYKNNTDHENCRISLTHIDDEDMVLHHWRYPKDWNDDSHENLILVSVDMHEWIHSNFHDEHLDWGKNGVVMYIANVMHRRIEEISINNWENKRNLNKIIEQKNYAIYNHTQNIEELTILKNHFRKRADNLLHELEKELSSGQK